MLRLTRRCAIVASVGLAIALVVTACGIAPPDGDDEPAAVVYRELSFAWHEPAESDSATPTALLVHGCCGDRRDLAELSRELARDGRRVANADLHAVADGGGWPETYIDVICAYAATAEMAGGQRVDVIGWGDGALVATAVALGWTELSELADDCAVPPPVSGPQHVVALSGHFGWVGTIGDDRVTHALIDWFGATPGNDPVAWSNGNPGWWIDQASASRDVSFTLITGQDGDASATFAEQLGQRGFDARLVRIDDAHPDELILPRSPRGATALDAIEAALGS